MSLTVETGSGSATAESYASVAAADAYWLVRDNPEGWSGEEATTGVKEAALRKATQFIDATYQRRWRGVRTNEIQALAWPRSNVEDVDGYTIASNAMPTKLLEATFEAALLHITETDGLMPDVDQRGIGRERVRVGPIEEDITFVGESDGQPVFTLVERLLSGLIISGSRVSRG